MTLRLGVILAPSRGVIIIPITGLNLEPEVLLSVFNTHLWCIAINNIKIDDGYIKLL